MPKRLSRAEVFYIRENPDNKSIEQLSKELGYGIPIIKKYMSPTKVVTVQEQSKQKSIPFEENADMRMGKRVKNNEVVATVMTPGASEVGDIAREKLGSVRLGKSIESAIHRPKGPSFNPKQEDPYKVIQQLQEEIKQLKANNG